MEDYTTQETAQRYERFIRELAKWDQDGLESEGLSLEDFGEWAMEQAENVLAGSDAECICCGTVVHEGDCVGDGDDDEDYEEEV
jgi:hypothetical protein